MKKRMTIMAIGLAVVFGGIIGFNLLKAFMIKRFFASYEPPAVSVSSVVAKRVTWQGRIPAVGTFVATSGVDVSADSAGKVVKINFESGQYVTKDTPLLDIDDGVDQAMLKFNEAELALKKLNFQRQSDLFKRGAAPVSSVDEARANLEQAQANMEKTQVEINHKHILAPFSGKLGIRMVNLGQYISQGQTAIVSLQALDPLYLEFSLPEQRLREISVGQLVEASVEGYPDLIFTGTITAINSRVDPITHNIRVQATLPNCPLQALANPNASPLVSTALVPNSSQKRLSCHTERNEKNRINTFSFIPGMFANVEVISPKTTEVTVVPSTSISYSLYGNSVFVIEKEPSGRKDRQGNPVLVVNRHFVTLGSQQDNLTVITKGIEPGQLVVSSGELKLDNGTRVVINNSVPLNDKPDFNTLSQ
ncbi:efflux RND transporter periplasmic adaptor subunit [Legionella geestiana]|uniref:efflux RND transporter periplasmic adaptor subunit n=1 Tax=Legionella geestiana TaxID=45065 RepID=UPI001092082B|nr:efflux RND transporter periplasmic adaptor subunit [Legionella geestiana]QDQ39150.1 efflux RND transporter periplasmic adaptor subunit [Legionella geestiana]